MNKMLTVGIINALILIISGINITSIQDNTFEFSEEAGFFTKAFEEVENCCIDGIDNEGDSSVDNEDGDCWIKEGAIVDSHLCVPPVKFSQWKELIPILHNIGFKTLYLFPVMQHQPEWNYYAVIDHFKLHPAMISDGKQETGEKELKELVDTAHAYGMKVIFDLPNAFVPSEELNGVNSWIWINHPDWVLRDIYGKPENTGKYIQSTLPTIITSLIGQIQR